MTRWIAFYTTFLLLLIASIGNGQSLPVGFTPYEDVLRRNQLLGKVDSSLSFNLRPYHLERVLMDSSVRPMMPLSVRKTFFKRLGRLEVLPAHFIAQLNTSHPYGWNDGPMVPAKGLQSYLSGGAFLKLGFFSMQLRPELVWAANMPFETFPENSALLSAYTSYHFNRADLPDRFGDIGYQRVYLGQSFAGFNAGPVFLGVSSENVWWGPARRNSLIMSNNAPGFYHATLKTTRPLKTAIGALEWQAVAGKLESSGIVPPHTQSYRPPRDDWRYFSGYTLTYSPKWIKGMHVGGSRVAQLYYQDAKRNKDYYPVFSDLFRRRTNFADDTLQRDHLLSLFMRWVWKKAQAEIYFEFGRNDASYNLRDFIMTPEHSRAYTMGFSKLLSQRLRGGNFQFSAEATQLEQTTNYIIRDARNWYTHWQVRHGYTHEGQVLGAGIGPGSNLQSMELSWIRSLDKLGIRLERLVNNNDFYYRQFRNNPLRQRWVDLSGSLLFDWEFGGLLVSSRATFIRSLNYYWQLQEETAGTRLPKGEDRFNFHAGVHLFYSFKPRGNK